MRQDKFIQAQKRWVVLLLLFHFSVLVYYVQLLSVVPLLQTNSLLCGLSIHSPPCAKHNVRFTTHQALLNSLMNYASISLHHPEPCSLQVVNNQITTKTVPKLLPCLVPWSNALERPSGQRYKSAVTLVLEVFGFLNYGFWCGDSITNFMAWFSQNSYQYVSKLYTKFPSFKWVLEWVARIILWDDSFKV